MLRDIMKLKDRILHLIQKYYDSMLDDIVFIDYLSRVYTRPNKFGENADSIFAPFAGKGSYECSIALKRMSEGPDPSNLDYDMFAVLDERSLEDGSVLLVPEPEVGDGGEGHPVRVIFDMLKSQVLMWTAGKTTVIEDRERAKGTVDGILRTGMDLQEYSVYL